MNYWQTVKAGYSIDFKFKVLANEYFQQIWGQTQESAEDFVSFLANLIGVLFRIVIWPIFWLLRPLLFWPFFYKKTVEKVYKEEQLKRNGRNSKGEKL
jgi:hypothetical protein